MKDNKKIVEVIDAEEKIQQEIRVSEREDHIEFLKNLPAEIKRVDFDDPRSIMEYGHDAKQAISDLLIHTAGLSINEGRSTLTSDMVEKIYSFDDELEESDKIAGKKELPVIGRVKALLTKLGVKKFQKEKELNSYGAKYEAYRANIDAVCKCVEESRQKSLEDINLRRQIALAMKPHLENLQLTIKAGEADYFLLIEEIEGLKKLAANTEDILEKENIESDIKVKEQLALVFKDKLDKLKKVFISYRQQLLVYAEQQHNEMILVTQQQAYIEDQKPILYAQGSSMIFNREQSTRADELAKLNEATNRAYQENAAALMVNTETISDLAINGGLQSESIQTLQEAIEHGINIIRDTQEKLNERIAADEQVIANVNATSDEFEQELQGIDEVLEGLTVKQKQKKLGTRYDSNKR